MARVSPEEQFKTETKVTESDKVIGSKEKSNAGSVKVEAKAEKNTPDKNAAKPAVEKKAEKPAVGKQTGKPIVQKNAKSAAVQKKTGKATPEKNTKKTTGEKVAEKTIAGENSGKSKVEETTEKTKVEKMARPCCCHDTTLEYTDSYYNVDVGTEFDTFFHGYETGYSEKLSENFSHIVDLDTYEYHKIVFHYFLGEILQSFIFRFAILLLVMVNSILIGIHTNHEFVDKNKTVFGLLDTIILSIFVFEIMLKWMYDFRLFWAVWWNVLDFFIVFLILLAAIIPVLGHSRAAVSIVRVVRAFRSLRSVSYLSSLTVVTHTMVRSIVDMLNILFVLIIFMLVMAIAGVILFDIENLNSVRFLSTFDAWFVLFVCVTQDGWIAILDEFRGNDDDESNETTFALIAIYLMIAVWVGAFVFANLIVAVVVANLEMSVRELRAEKVVTDNPLVYHGHFSLATIEVLAVYQILANRNIPLLAQRPMTIPTTRHMSLRRLQTYVTLIVALEENMLEYAVLLKDFEKVMSVLLTMVQQLDQNGPTLEEETARGKDALRTVSFMSKAKLPSDTLDRLSMSEDMKKLKRTRSKGSKA